MNSRSRKSCDLPITVQIQDKLIRQFPSTKFWHTKLFVIDIFDSNDLKEIIIAEHNRAHRSIQENVKQVFFFLLSFLDPDRDIGHQQCQLFTELLTGTVVSNQARFCLDSYTPFPQFVCRSHKVYPFFFQYHPEDSIA